MAAPRGIAIEATSITPTTTWTVASVRSALVEHDEGTFDRSASLCEQLLRDPAIYADLSTRVRAIAARSGLPFSIEPVRGVDDRRASALARRVDAAWHDIAPESAIEAIMADTVLLGVAVGYVRWETSGGEWVPRLEHLPAHGLRYSEHERAYRYLTGDGRDLVVTPGDGTWFLHAPHGPRSWLWGAVRALGLPWLMSTLTYRDWARYNEKHGLPVLKVTEPYYAADDVEGPGGTGSGGTASSVYAQFRRLGSESVLRMPQGANPSQDGGWDVEWVEPSSSSYQSFELFLRQLRGATRSIILGYDDAASKGGDGELSSQRIKVEYLAADCEPLSTSLRRQVLAPWVRYNVDASRPELAPWPRWDTRPLPDLRGRAQVLDVLGDALAKLSAQGVDTSAIIEEFQLRRSSAPIATPPAEPPQDGGQPQ